MSCHRFQRLALSLFILSIAFGSAQSLAEILSPLPSPPLPPLPMSTFVPPVLPIISPPVFPPPLTPTPTLTPTPSSCSQENISAWDPSITELPPGSYERIDLGFDSQYWTFQYRSNTPILKVLVAPPVTSTLIPYQLGVDYKGTYQNCDPLYSTEIQFMNPGVYFVQILSTIGNTTRVVLVGAASNEVGDSDCPPDSRPAEVPTPQGYNNILRQFSDSDGPMYQLYSNSVRFNSPETLLNLISAVTPPMSVLIHSHGVPGGLFVNANQTMTGTSSGSKTFADMFKGKMRNLFLVACCIGKNLDTDDKHLMKVLSKGLSSATLETKVQGYDTTVYHVYPGFWERFRPAYLAVGRPVNLRTVGRSQDYVSGFKRICNAFPDDKTLFTYTDPPNNQMPQCNCGSRFDSLYLSAYSDLSYADMQTKFQSDCAASIQLNAQGNPCQRCQTAGGRIESGCEEFGLDACIGHKSILENGVSIPHVCVLDKSSSPPHDYYPLATVPMGQCRRLP